MLAGFLRAGKRGSRAGPIVVGDVSENRELRNICHYLDLWCKPYALFDTILPLIMPAGVGTLYLEHSRHWQRRLLEEDMVGFGGQPKLAFYFVAEHERLVVQPYTGNISRELSPRTGFHSVMIHAPLIREI